MSRPADTFAGLARLAAWAFDHENLTGETKVQAHFLHLMGDFSHPTILRYMSGNSSDISKR